MRCCRRAPPGLSQLVFGIILIAVILWRPRGFITVIDSLRGRAVASGAAS